MEIQSADSSRPSNYNVQGGFVAIKQSILLHAVHEMTDVQEIRQFLILSKSMQNIVSDSLFPWSVAPALSHSYELRALPVERADLV